MATPYKGAFLGFGLIAEKGHWPAYSTSKTMQIVAVVDSSPARRSAAQKLNSQWHVYATVDELFAKEKLDFVDICTPPNSHTALSARALEKGLHVLCEKPLTLDQDEYAQLSRLAVEKKRSLFTVHNWKYAPIVQKTIEFIESQCIGKVWHAEVFTLRNSHCKGAPENKENWRQDAATAGGGVLIDHGWHAFYLLMRLMQQEPRTLQATLRYPDDKPDALEDTAEILVQFPQGDGYIHLTWCSDVRRNSITVQGLEGMLLVDDNRILLTTGAGQQEEFHFEESLSAGSHHAEWFPPLLNDFYEEMRNPAKRHENLREAGWCLALTRAAYDSAKKGLKEVEVSLGTELTA